MITPQEAWAILSRIIVPLEPISSPLEQSLGACLAEPIVADADIPPADRAAMDGYALRSDDLDHPGLRLIVDGEVAAGAAVAHHCRPGNCLRIFTGANLPAGADTVVAVEQTTTGSFERAENDREIGIVDPPRRGANIFRCGENARAGATLIEAGRRLGPRQLGLAAATGHAAVRVHPRPRVMILNTGAELLDAAEPAAPHQTRNANGPLLVAALSEAGIAGVNHRRVNDTLRATIDALGRALAQADAVIVTGGISAGRHDCVPAALEALGARLHYRGIAMKPGKPQLFATAQGRLIFGLPGNPLSSLVGLWELVLPALRRFAGWPLDRCRPVYYLPLAETVEHRGGRQLVLPALLDHAPSGSRLIPTPPIGSADLVTGARVDGAIIIPPGAGRLQAGTVVPFRSWGGADA